MKSSTRIPGTTGRLGDFAAWVLVAALCVCFAMVAGMQAALADGSGFSPFEFPEAGLYSGRTNTGGGAYNDCTEEKVDDNVESQGCTDVACADTGIILSGKVYGCSPQQG